ncbi:hypothetical protein [Paenibacillus taiwanensis]|uniref:hypothetical protein n=1 Tax=Paenibacillus taiwanensis TaxID=401638 RepID=UPI0003F991FC|nr:hypothetical protein [Paenibacillus taiwanensis]
MHPRNWIRDGAVILVGMIVGACVYHAIFMHQVDELVMRNLDLQDQLSHFRSENEDLLRYKNRATVIKSISIHIYGPGSKDDIPQSDETELRKRLSHDLAGLKGRNVFQIDEYAKLVEGLLTRKLYTDIQARDYTVSLRTMLVTEGVLHVWVDVKSHVPAAP